LPRKRKELHLKVASSIEKVFSRRLHEFYGMLAYHYSRAENAEKAEEYLINAGEEALESSASNEALHYYQKALDLYLKNYGDAADPERVATIEKSIALALYNKGQYDKAIEYFDNALSYYWGELPKHRMAEIFRFLSGIFHLLVSLYLPFLKFLRDPTRSDNEALNLFFKKLKALVLINPKKYFIESLHFYRRLTQFNLTKCELGVGMFAGASNLFSFTGISFRLSRKILHFLKNRIEKDDVKSFTIFDFSDTLHKYLKGNWKSINEYDDDLVNRNLSIGEIYWATQHLYWHGSPKIYQGYFDIPKLLLNKLNDIFSIYENDLSILLRDLLNSDLLLEFRELQDALIEIENGIEFAQKKNDGTVLIYLFSCKARIHILMRNIDEAEKAFEHAKEIKEKVDAVPWELSGFYKSQFELDLYLLKKSISKSSKKGLFKFRKKAFRSGKILLKISSKVAQHRTEAFRLFGEYYWLINKPKKAFMWWKESIKEGERLGARLQLSRTYFEIGKWLLESDGDFKQLNTLKAEEYLEKARLMFEEMDLQWDLKQLSQLVKG
jgi:tetratricopeptide (TPR) repeat protein